MISEILQNILNNEKPFRRKQIEKARFDLNINGYSEITTLPVELKEKLSILPWTTLKVHTELKSKQDNTRKYLFELEDGNYIETVVMGRENLKEDAPEDAADRYTICISSQAGCPMGCVFCATGKGGFKRNLTAEEIIDQVRFSQRLLSKENARVANVVVMGQGEPLLNYDNLKRALEVILANTDIGPTKITVSTAGVVPMMEKLLEDKTFPPIRWAISLHSAIEVTRKQIMPSHQTGFLDFLVDWANKYHRQVNSRSHFLGLEYIMLGGFNDDDKHLTTLIKLCKKLPHIRINLIPFNTDDSKEKALYTRASEETTKKWHEALMNAGFVSTIRHSHGQDIAAACGQLANKMK